MLSQFLGMLRSFLVVCVALLALVPAAMGGAVVLDESNFDDLVFNSGKSAFVKFFAPW